MPSESPIDSDSRKATPMSSSVAGRRPPIISSTGWFVVKERPKSPFTRLPAQTK